VHFLIVGNYGAGNVGDEALLASMLEMFPEVQWQILSAKPKVGQLPRFPGGIRTFLRMDWLKTFRALRASDGLVFGGGSLFTDVESVSACFIWWVHVMVARLCGKPVFLAFQGIGPFRTRSGLWLASSAVRSAAFVSVRDPLSFDRVKKMSSTKLMQTFDPVYGLLRKEKHAHRSQNILVVIPRHNSPAVFCEHIALQAQLRKMKAVHILSMQPDDPQEKVVCEELRIAIECPTQLIAVHSWEELAPSIAHASVVISHRYHGALAALAVGVPVEIWQQGEGDKLSTLRNVLNTDPATLDALLACGVEGLRKELQFYGRKLSKRMIE